MKSDGLSWLFSETYESTDPVFNWTKEQRPTNFEKNDLGSDRLVHLESYGLIDARQSASLKYARFWNEKIDIATVMIYPTVSFQIIPVFAAEWVLVGNRFHVIVQDIEFLENLDRISNFPKFPKNWMKEFQNHKEPPVWFKEIASPYAIFSNRESNQMPKVKEMFHDYLNYALRNCYIPSLELVESGSDCAQIIEYKKHHSENSPARQFFKSTDKEWLDEFLDQYHFGIYETNT